MVEDRVQSEGVGDRFLDLIRGHLASLVELPHVRRHRNPTRQLRGCTRLLRVTLTLLAAAIATSAVSAQILPPCCTNGTDSAGGLIPTASPAPRLYIHYREGGQAAGVEALRQALAGTRVANRPLQALVPAGEPRSTFTRTALVCGRPSDCVYAPELAAILQRLLGRPVAVNNQSKVSGAGATRPLHFELWFDRHPVTLAATAPAATPTPSLTPTPTPTAKPTASPAVTPPPATTVSEYSVWSQWSTFAALLSVVIIGFAGAWLALRRRATDRVGSQAYPPATIAPSGPLPTASILEGAVAPRAFADGEPAHIIVQDPWEPDPPDRLVTAIANREAVVVVGAGASELSGLPTPNQLILLLVRRLGPQLPKSVISLLGDHPTEETLIALSDKLGGAGKLFEAVISAIPRDTVIELLGQASPIEPSPLHAAIARLPWRAVVDFNLDDLMVRALTIERGQPAEPIVEATVNDSADIVRSSRSTDGVLFRPFGAYNQPSTIALTAEEMRRSVSRAPDFQRTLSSLLQSYSLFFVGLSAEEVEQFFYAFGADYADSRQRHFLFLKRDPVSALRVSSLARFGVLLLEYDPQPDGSSPTRFCRALREQVRARDRSVPPDDVPSSTLKPDRISRIRLQNIGPFDDIELSVADGLATPAADDSPADTGQSPWWVLFGGNGVGKSTVLRALGVVLAGNTPASAAAGKRLLKTGAPHGLIEVQIGSQTFRTRIHSERSNVLVSPSQKSPVELGTMLALGFPALRGARTADPSGPTARSEIVEPEPADLDPLISGDVDGRLADFKQWLVNTLSSAERDPRASVRRALINDIIREIIPGQIEALAPLRPGDFVIRVQTPEGEVPFDELSQGMASIFNWVGLLAQRLFTICGTSPNPQNEPAIVIIDEIDAHLHPEWQRRLVPLTRRFFPNVQIIATSHSPLLAGSLRTHEMAVLGRNANTDRIGAVPHGATYGLMSQDIMTSGVFAMATDRNPEVEALIARYFELYESRQRSADDEREMAGLREQLDRYGFGATGTVNLPTVDAEHLEELRQRFGPAPEATA